MQVEIVAPRAKGLDSEVWQSYELKAAFAHNYHRPAHNRNVNCKTPSLPSRRGQVLVLGPSAPGLCFATPETADPIRVAPLHGLTPSVFSPHGYLPVPNFKHAKFRN